MAEAKGFSDPVVRCTECQTLITRDEISTSGGCPRCGCKRVRNVLTLNEAEAERVKTQWPEFAALFEEKGATA